MTGLVSRATFLTACGLIIASSSLATTPGVPVPSACDVPCAIVLVGCNAANNAADPYGAFSVTVRDNGGVIGGSIVTVDFTDCCPDIKLSNTQLGLGVIHAANAAIVTGVTDVTTGTVTFTIQGAASQGTGPYTGLVSPTGCAIITATPSGGGTPVLLTDGSPHQRVLVSTPDENGAVGTPGVDVTDLSVYVFDKDAYFVDPAVYTQRSDFDFHLPAYNCSAVFAPSFGLGDNLGDLVEWIAIKNAAGSLHNGPFPVTCP
jgi:hypothetical protein